MNEAPSIPAATLAAFTVGQMGSVTISTRGFPTPKLTETEYAGMAGWAGVHYNGKVIKCTGAWPCNQTHSVNTRFSGKRVPLMGDSKLLLSWSNPLCASPHFWRWGDPWNYYQYKGIGNVLFNDGSVLAYPYSY